MSILLCLLLAGNQAESMVLCVGHGGHLEVEAAGHGICCEHEHEELAGCHDDNQHNWQLQTDGDCLFCLDIPLSLGVGNVFNCSSSTGQSFMAVISTVAVVDDARAVNRCEIDVLPCYLERQQLSSLETVILLT